MKLTELSLNRFLYKNALQNLETKDSVYDSSNIIAAEVPAIASGGAAQDINIGNVTINGNVLTPGSIPATTLDVSNWGWNQTCVFSIASATQVNWGAGTFKSANGVLYSISGGNTGTMSAKTYIYLDLNVSLTAYQTTTTSANAVGVGKVLIAIAQNGATSASFNTIQANQITGDNIIANTIDASKIVAGSITSTQISSGYIYAGSILANQVTAGTFTGFTIQTATTGYRLKMSSSPQAFQFLYNDTILAQLVSTTIPETSDNGASLEGTLQLVSLGLHETGEGMGDSYIGFSIKKTVSTWDYFTAVCNDTFGEDNFITTTLPIQLANLNADPATPYDGSIYYNTVSKKVVARLNGTWTDIAGSGANTDLSNLTTTSINESLIPDTDASYTIGNATYAWNEIYSGTVYVDYLTSRTTGVGGNMVFMLDPLVLAQATSDPTSVDGGLYYKTDTDEIRAKINGSWVSLSTTGGANTALSNLASTAVNADILPGADATRYLGNASYQWYRVYVSDNMYFRGTAQGVTYFGYCSGTTISRSYIGGSWTLSHPSTGNYTITHNLNSSLYIAVVSAVRASGTGAYIAKVESFSANSFNVIVFDDTGAAVDGDFTFILINK